MSLIIYRMELWRNFKSFIIWTATVCGMLFFGMMFYPAINTGDLLKQIEPIFNTPMLKGVLAVFGADLTNLGNVMGFYVTYNSFYNLLLGCIFASVLAGNLLAREEAEKTAEFLFSRPVSRRSIFISKAAVLFTYIILLSVFFFLTSILSIEVIKPEVQRRLEISKSDKELLIEHIEAHSDQIYEVFNITDKSFPEYSLTFASDLLSENRAELREMNLDINDMGNLIAEAMENPEAFFESVLTNPEDYMPLFSIPPEQEEDFLENVLKEQQEYYQMRESFYSSPDLFIQFFDENPGLALSQFVEEPGSMFLVIERLELPEDFESRVFRKYSIRKVFIFCVYICLLLCCTGSLVLFVSLMIRRGGSVVGLAVGSAMLLYFIKSITGLAAGFSKAAVIIGFISPFSWIDTDINSLSYGLTWWRIGLFMLITAAAALAAGFRLNRKDILV